MTNPAPRPHTTHTYPHLGETISINGAQLVVDAIELTGDQLTVTGSIPTNTCTLTLHGPQLDILNSIDQLHAHPALEGADGPLHIGDTIKAGAGKVIWTITAFSYGWNGLPQVSVRSQGPSPQGNTYPADQLTRLHHVTDETEPHPLAQDDLFSTAL